MLMVLYDCLLVLNKMSYVYRRKTIACWPIFLRSKIFSGIMGGFLNPSLATPLYIGPLLNVLVDIVLFKHFSTDLEVAGISRSQLGGTFADLEERQRLFLALRLSLVFLLVILSFRLLLGIASSIER
jgi:hypothetical protein